MKLRPLLISVVHACRGKPGFFPWPPMHRLINKSAQCPCQTTGKLDLQWIMNVEAASCIPAVGELNHQTVPMHEEESSAIIYVLLRITRLEWKRLCKRSKINTQEQISSFWKCCSATMSRSLLCLSACTWRRWYRDWLLQIKLPFSFLPTTKTQQQHCWRCTTESEKYK